MGERRVKRLFAIVSRSLCRRRNDGRGNPEKYVLEDAHPDELFESPVREIRNQAWGGKRVEPNIEPCQTVPGFTNLPFLHTLVHPRYWPGPWVDVHGCKKVLLSSKLWRDIGAQQSEE